MRAARTRWSASSRRWRTTSPTRSATSRCSSASAHDVMTAKTNTEKKAALNRDLIHLDALGSGSDFTPFLQHAGIAALSIGYDGESDGGSYHSIYDSFDHYVRFGDPTFDYGVVQAKTTGRITLRFAD